MNDLVPIERIEQYIYLIREEKVMLDADLAELYGTDVAQLTRQVRRNESRFPVDFAFQLNEEEWEILKCQIGISRSWGGRRHPPYVFTEQGVSMLSSVLNSERAVIVNIAIMRTFVQLRKLLGSHKEIARKLLELEKTVGAHDTHIRTLFEAIRQLMNPPEPPAEEKPRIGYKVAS